MTNLSSVSIAVYDGDCISLLSPSERKGIIHTTSYEQLKFIKQDISKFNHRRDVSDNAMRTTRPSRSKLRREFVDKG